MIHINFWAVIVSAIAAFIIGFMFHGPLLGKTWMRLANIVPTGKEKLSDMYGQMFWNFVINVVTAIALSVIISFAVGSGIVAGTVACIGLVCALIVWAGFLVTSSSVNVIWMGHSRKLWMFEAFSSLVTMSAMGLILGAWY